MQKFGIFRFLASKNSVFSGFSHRKNRKINRKETGMKPETGQDKNGFQFLKTRQDKTGIGSIPV